MYRIIILENFFEKMTQIILNNDDLKLVREELNLSTKSTEAIERLKCLEKQQIEDQMFLAKQVISNHITDDVIKYVLMPYMRLETISEFYEKINNMFEIYDIRKRYECTVIDYNTGMSHTWRGFTIVHNGYFNMDFIYMSVPERCGPTLKLEIQKFEYSPNIYILYSINNKDFCWEFNNYTLVRASEEKLVGKIPFIDIIFNECDYV